MKDKKRLKRSTPNARYEPQRSTLNAQRSKQRSALNADSVLDISDRKEAEQAKNLLIEDLNRSQQYFRALFNRTPSAVGISTVAEGRLRDVNEGFSRLTGYTREELLGRTTLELGLWADPSERATVIRELQEQGSLHNREVLLRTKSGEIRSLMVTVDSIQLGSTPCLIYLAHDITERKRTEEVLRFAKFSMDRAADAVYWIDAQAKVLDVNEAASRMLGYSKDELCAMTVHELNPDFQADMWPGFWTETRKSGTMVFETVHRAKNGRLIPIEVSVNFLSYEGKEYHCAFVRDITERKRAEVLLAAEKKVLELIATGAAMPEVLDTLMRETEAQSTDGMLCSILLLDESGQTLLHGAAPSLPEAYNAAVHGLVIGPSVGSCGTAAFERKPVFVTDIAADPRWADFKDVAAAHGLGACHSTPILSSEGRLLGTIAMYYRRPHNPGAHDRHLIERATQLAGIVIERKQGEEALRESEERFRSLITVITDVPWVTDPIGAFIAPQPAWEAYTGQSWEQHRGFGWAEALHPDDRERVKAIWLKACEATILYESHGRIWHAPSQRWRYFLAHATPLFNADGSVRQWVGTCTDVDDAKRSEAALRESEERHRLALSAGKFGNWQLDLATMELQSSKQCKGNFGRDPEAPFTYEMFCASIHPEDRPTVEQRVAEAISQCGDYEADCRCIWPDGSIHWINAMGRASGEHGKAARMVGVTRDISERKQAEAQLQEALTRLLNLSHRVDVVREEERTRIARELHDELGVRLTCLKMDLARLQSLVSRHRMEEKVRTMTAEVDTTIASVQRLVAELRPGVLDDLGLVAAIDWQCQDFERRSGIRCVCEASHIEISLDRSRTTAAFRICQEALTNVIRHAEATAVNVRLDRKDDRLLLEIHDNGRGIAPDKWSDSQSFGLMGMRERAGALGGQVHIVGESGVGTTVTLDLPMANS